MFIWTDPFKQNTKKEVDYEHSKGKAPGLVSAQWLALDSILRSLILDPEGPEIRSMMRRDLRVIHAAGQVCECNNDTVDAYQEAAGVMSTWRKSFS